MSRDSVRYGRMTRRVNSPEMSNLRSSNSRTPTTPLTPASATRPEMTSSHLQSPPQARMPPPLHSHQPPQSHRNETSGELVPVATGICPEPRNPGHLAVYRIIVSIANAHSAYSPYAADRINPLPRTMSTLVSRIPLKRLLITLVAWWIE